MSARAMACLAAAAVLGCGSTGLEERNTFEEPRSYAYDLFETPEACAAAQPPDSFFNCQQTVDFEPDGTVRLVVTDIVNQGTYEIHLGRVVMRFPMPVDMGSGWRFEARAGGDLLVDQYGREWRRVPTLGAGERSER